MIYFTRYILQQQRKVLAEEDTMNKVLETRVLRNRSLNPRIEMFSPFSKPFATSAKESGEITKYVIVSPKVVEYMRDDTTKIVAKCTPCQCCACR